MEDIKWWEEQEHLWNDLVPSSGQAETVQGELIRCTGKITDEAYRNGNINWESGYEKLVRYVENLLTDSRTFDKEEINKINNAADEIINNYESPDLSGHGSSYYYLTEMAVRFCMKNPEPILHKKNADINI